MKRRLVAATLTLACASAGVIRAQETNTAPSKANAVKVTGFIAPCYRPNKWIVFVTSIPRGGFESSSIVVGGNGRFTFVLDKAKVKPGDYVLNFGKTKKEAGGRRFTVKADTRTVDLRQLGECDV